MVSVLARLDQTSLTTCAVQTVETLISMELDVLIAAIWMTSDNGTSVGNRVPYLMLNPISLTSVGTRTLEQWG